MTSPPEESVTPSATPSETPTATPTLPVKPTIVATPTATRVVPPTALQLRYFQASQVDATILLTWETIFETEVYGFRLWRSTDGIRTNAKQMTGALIVGRGTAGTGATYYFTDENVAMDTEYTYWLEQLALDESREDIASTRGHLNHWLYLPAIRR
ncbi:MAG: hypothetical protein R2932_33270 [Caldilineaceae bacterium]